MWWGMYKGPASPQEPTVTNGAGSGDTLPQTEPLPQDDPGALGLDDDGPVSPPAPPICSHDAITFIGAPAGNKFF